MENEIIIIDYLIRPADKEKLFVAKEKLKKMDSKQLSKIIKEKYNQTSKIHESYDSQYYNIMNDEKNKVLRQKIVNELGRLAFAKRQQLETEFLDKILEL